MDCSLPGFSVHEIYQARILERVAIFYSRVSFKPRDQTNNSCISCIGRWLLLPLCHLGSCKTHRTLANIWNLISFTPLSYSVCYRHTMLFLNPGPPQICFLMTQKSPFPQSPSLIPILIPKFKLSYHFWNFPWCFLTTLPGLGDPLVFSSSILLTWLPPFALPQQTFSSLRPHSLTAPTLNTVSGVW